MARFLALLTLVLASMSACAEEPVDAPFQALLAKLADDSWSVREQAEQDLIGLGPAARPLIEKEIERTEDAEIKMRLRNALREIGKPRWATGIKAALEQAARLKRPIFLVCADGPLDTPHSRAGVELRRELAKTELATELNARFVLLWWNAEVKFAPDDRDPKVAPSEEGDAGPTGVIGIYFCTSKGVVRHFLPGWWTSVSIHEDLERLKPVFEAPDAGEGIKIRLDQARSVEAAADTKATDNPAEMAKPSAESPVRREVERLRRVAAGYHAGDDVVGETVEGYLNRRVADIRARWFETQPDR
ncbi:MAG: hypothetical protein K8T20_03710 [Planctomycetes bacterium]|nr:hypothetical protein [Planctomycetota bacterium]